MAPVNSGMASKEGLIDKISEILQTEEDLGFLSKLAPKELTLLTAHLQNSMKRGR